MVNFVRGSFVRHQNSTFTPIGCVFIREAGRYDRDLFHSSGRRWLGKVSDQKRTILSSSVARAALTTAPSSSQLGIIAVALTDSGHGNVRVVEMKGTRDPRLGTNV